MISAELSQILQFLVIELGIPLGLVLLFHFKIYADSCDDDALCSLSARIHRRVLLSRHNPGEA